MNKERGADYLKLAAFQKHYGHLMQAPAFQLQADMLYAQLIEEGKIDGSFDRTVFNVLWARGGGLDFDETGESEIEPLEAGDYKGILVVLALLIPTFYVFKWFFSLKGLFPYGDGSLGLPLVSTFFSFFGYCKLFGNNLKNKRVLKRNEQFYKDLEMYSTKNDKSTSGFSSSNEDDFSAEQGNTQGDYGFDQNQWSGASSNSNKRKAKEQPYGLDLSRFNDKKMQEKYRKRQNIVSDPNASPSERQSALNWMIAADNGEVEGIKALATI